jgi:polyketide synthase PksN
MTVDRDQLLQLTETYLTNVVLDAFEEADPPLDVADHPFEVDTPFRDFGIDSFLVLKILIRLEQDFGTLPKTLMFERTNIHELATYLVEDHGETAIRVVSEESHVPAT